MTDNNENNKHFIWDQGQEHQVGIRSSVYNISYCLMRGSIVTRLLLVTLSGSGWRRQVESEKMAMIDGNHVTILCGNRKQIRHQSHNNVNINIIQLFH